MFENDLSKLVLIFLTMLKNFDVKCVMADSKLVRYKNTRPALSRTLPDASGRGVLHLLANCCVLTLVL